MVWCGVRGDKKEGRKKERIESDPHNTRSQLDETTTSHFPASQWFFISPSFRPFLAPILMTEKNSTKTMEDMAMEEPANLTFDSVRVWVGPAGFPCVCVKEID